MLKGLSITPPILGRISIGKMTERNGKRLPMRDDQFTITSQMQTPEGWLPHPLDESLRDSQQGKLRSLPIRLLFNDPALNFRAEYSVFDRVTGRPVCVGNGETCLRRTEAGIKSLPCPGPLGCGLAASSHCKPFGRLNVVMGDDDPLGSFIFRTTGFNSIRTLSARLQYFQAISGDRLSCLPLALKLRGKSTRMSHGSPVYYVDITLRDGMTLEAALQQAQQTEDARKASGFDQQALDQAARLGFSYGEFEEQSEDIADIVDEFYPVTDTPPVQAQCQSQSALNGSPENEKITLADKLEAKASHLGRL